MLKSNWEAIKNWESKRFKYNVLNAAATVVSFLFIYLIIPSLVNYFIVPFVLAYFVLINLIYLSFWFPIIIINSSWVELKIEKILSVLYSILCYYTVLMTLSICLVLLALNIP